MTSLNTGVGPISLDNLEFSFPIPSWELVCKDFKNVKTATHIQKAQVLSKHITSVATVVNLTRHSEDEKRYHYSSINSITDYNFNMKQFHGPL